MTAAAVEIRQFVVHAARRCVLDIRQLSIDAGGIVALMGPNGAGKSTLLRACLGLLKPERGECRVLDLDVSTLRGVALAGLRRRIGYVPQLLPGRSELPITVREVVAIGRTARAGWFRSLSAGDWRVVDEWIARLGLAALADRVFSSLSGGEQRKAIIARAMAQEPELLLLDEPTANLDLGWREIIVDAIQALHASTAISIVLVCHELEVLPPACQQVVLLQDGRVSAQGLPQDVFTDERVAGLYGAGLRVVHGSGRHAVVPGAGNSPIRNPHSDRGGPHD